LLKVSGPSVLANDLTAV